MKNFVFFLCLAALLSCRNTPSGKEASIYQFASLSNDFKNYWYQGKAELTSYDLEQSRYGEIHPGHAVLVFVTEDLSRSKQVKLDTPRQVSKENKVKVMKLNYIKKFTTGIYPYSMMQSIFTPVHLDEYPQTVKVTMSSQEWCGHVFVQYNLEEDHYRAHQFSYFESEGDKVFNLDDELLEDEIWNRIRIAPESIPLGEMKMIPSTFYLRLTHQESKPYKVNISANELDAETDELRLEYPELKRSISIRFQREFPRKIISWEETYPSLSFAGGEMLTTKATLKETVITDYWTKNQRKHLFLRDSLGLDQTLVE